MIIREVFSIKFTVLNFSMQVFIFLCKLFHTRFLTHWQWHWFKCPLFQKCLAISFQSINFKTYWLSLYQVAQLWWTVGKNFLLQVQHPRGHILPFKNGNSNLVAFFKTKKKKLKDESCRDLCIPVTGDYE